MCLLHLTNVRAAVVTLEKRNNTASNVANDPGCYAVRTRDRTSESLLCTDVVELQFSKVINKRKRPIYKPTNVMRKEIAATQPAPSVPRRGLGLKGETHFVPMPDRKVWYTKNIRRERNGFLF